MPANATLKSLVGHAVLVRCNPDANIRQFQGVKEYIIEAASPSGQRIKMETLSGAIFWCEAGDYELVEDLGLSE